MQRMSIRVHGTCVAYGARAALLRGASGSGKSDLALRFLSAFAGPHRAALVADDQVEITRRSATLWARAPASIAGRMEVRGVGIVRVPSRRRAALVLVIDLVAADAVPRLPDPQIGEELLGVSVARIALAPFEASAPVKLKLALTGRL